MEGTEAMELDSYQVVLQTHKTNMKKTYKNLFEGIKTIENQTLLNSVYTQLFLINQRSEMENMGHEVLKMESKHRKYLQETPIDCLEIFKPLQDSDGETREEITAAEMDEGLDEEESEKHEKSKMQKPRTVLTQGATGSGKTVSVQKFTLDWAEGNANQDIDFLFVLPFRELNVIKDDQYSFHGLLCVFYPELRDLDTSSYDQHKVLFIFDGLDESRVSLNFEDCDTVSDVTMNSSAHVLITNLIKGELLPSAHIWITSRPSAVNQIPPQYVNRVTEIQGFNDSQMELCIRKRTRDEDEAQKIISHIKTVRSLHIMCQIPVFCWISASVLQQIMNEGNTTMPNTLSEIYSHFLITQVNMSNDGYAEKDEKEQSESNRTMLLKLAEMAYKQLIKCNVIFYEEDLRECGIDAADASVFSRSFSEFFKEERVLYQKKIYSFVHLSFQEFLAAVHILHCYQSKNMEVLLYFQPWHSEWSGDITLEDLLCGAVDKAVESDGNGHLNLFLRFLLGITLGSNQRLLQGLLTYMQNNPEKTTEYIKILIKKDCDLPFNNDINLFLCLYEMNDRSFAREVQEYLTLDKPYLSPAQCSALAYMLVVQDKVLDELDMRKIRASHWGYWRFVPAVFACRKAILIDRFLIDESYEILCSALQSENCSLSELDLCNSTMSDSRMELLCTGLKGADCKLETLRLGRCLGTPDRSKELASALQSVNFSVKYLDLCNNDLYDSGVELLSTGLKGSHCKLETLRLANCQLTTNCCDALASVLQTCSLKDLDLSNNDLQDSGVESLSAGLKSSYCKLETLRLAVCKLEGKSCEHLASAVLSALCSVKELDLSNNNLQDSGVELLSAGLKSSHCKLETLRLSGCMVTEKGCSFLASALESNSSHLRELDLSFNHPGESGVKMLSALQESPHCALHTLRMEHGGKIRIDPGIKKYACNLTLDQNTAHRHLSVSEDHRKVTHVNEKQPYPDHPDRFKENPQILCRESLTGRCYWEVEWSGDVEIAVMYKNNSGEHWFGWYDKFWSFSCRDDEYGERYHNELSLTTGRIFDPLPSGSHRVGVYLDWSVGSLSFYRIEPETNTLIHVHTFRIIFTEPLYTGFKVGSNSSASLCEVE